MTQENWDDYRFLLQMDFGEFGYNLLSKAKLGNFSGLDMNVKKLKILRVLIDIVMYYDLVSLTDLDLNYFSRTKMITIADYINRLLKKTYNPDFVLTT